MWSAIEDAGFVIQDTIMWLYGSGFPKGRAQLKPAFELICVAYKPGGKREVQIDECRVPTSGEDMGDPARANRLGRWPANVCHDGSDEVLAAFAAFGKDKGAFAPVRGHEPSHTGDNGIYHRFERVPGPFFGDTGTVARFFYCAKAGKADRTGSKHPTVKPIELLKWLVALVTPKNGLVLDCFAGSGTTAIAARATGRNAVLIEKESEYVADIRRRLAQNADRHSAVVKNRNRADVQGTLP